MARPNTGCASSRGALHRATHRYLLATAALFASAWAPTAYAQNCAPFTDVLASDQFCVNIQWMYNRQVTLGCATGQYCPTAFVRRDQMAAFMNRLANSLFPLTCASGQVMKWNGTAWTCANDNSGGGGPANAYVQGGNAFGTTAVLGTTDYQALDLRSNGQRVMRYEPNAISPNVIGGHPLNAVAAGVRGATIGGGGAGQNQDPDLDGEAPNRVTDNYGTVGGGVANVAGNGGTGAVFNTVGGGYGNLAFGQFGTIAGGTENATTDLYATVSGGISNSATGFAASVGGGRMNAASGRYGVVAGGVGNEATGEYSFAAGFSNRAEGIYSVAIGAYGDAPGTNGVAIGYLNKANGARSIAMGSRAISNGQGTMQFADSNNFDFTTSTPNAFRVRATGGVRMVVDIDNTGASTWSCLLTSGNAWSCSSDRNLKQDLVELDGEQVLDKLAAMPVYQWQPKGKNAHVKHYGPTAQDFHAAFGLGDDDTMIGFQDADGVALAAIRGLNAKLETKVAAQSREIAELRRAVEVLLARTSPEGRMAER